VETPQGLTKSDLLDLDVAILKRRCLF
jgi:hypothetical protein